MDPVKIFVSHKSQDKEFCDRFVEGLKRVGADVWYDEQDIHAGELLDQIGPAIRDRPIFVVVLSKAALQSEWVLRECRWARRLKDKERWREIVPVVGGEMEENDFDTLWFLSDMKWVEAPGKKPLSPDEAVEHTIQLLKRHFERPDSDSSEPEQSLTAEDLIAIGNAYSADKDYTEAIMFFERAVQLDLPETEAWEVWFNLGSAYSEVKRWEDSTAAYGHALSIDPDDPIAWINMGVALHRLQRRQEAQAAFDRAVVACDKLLTEDTKDANDPAVYFNKGLALSNLKRYEEALNAYSQVLALNPDDTDAWQSKGDMLYVLRHYKEALAPYDSAIAFDRKNSAAYLGKSGALGKLNRHKEALEASDRAIALAPEDPDMWNGKAWELFCLKKFEDALFPIDRALTLDPKNADALDTKGQILTGLRRYEEALAYLEQALTIEPQDASFWRSKAAALRGLGRKKEAEEAEKRAKALDEAEKRVKVLAR